MSAADGEVGDDDGVPALERRKVRESLIDAEALPVPGHGGLGLGNRHDQKALVSH
jgi:hypothetical protein